MKPSRQSLTIILCTKYSRPTTYKSTVLMSNCVAHILSIQGTRAITTIFHIIDVSKGHNFKNKYLIGTDFQICLRDGSIYINL